MTRFGHRNRVLVDHCDLLQALRPRMVRKSPDLMGPTTADRVTAGVETKRPGRAKLRTCYASNIKAQMIGDPHSARLATDSPYFPVLSSLSTD